MSTLTKALSRLPNYLKRFGIGAGLRLWARMELRTPRGTAGQSLRAYRVPGYAEPFFLRESLSDRSIFWQCIVRDQYALHTFPQAARLMQAYRQQRAAGQTPLILDCGGNIGLSVRWFAARFPEARIVVVEPDDNNIAVLRANVACLGERVTVVQGGVWSHDCHLAVTHRERGSAGLQVSEVPPGTAGAVPALAVSSLLALGGRNDPWIVKMDIEGAQAAVFSGDTSWLRGTDALMIELDDWQFPWAGTSRSFFAAMAPLPADYLLSGELLVCFVDKTPASGFGAAADRPQSNKPQ